MGCKVYLFVAGSCSEDSATDGNPLSRGLAWAGACTGKTVTGVVR